MKKNIIKLPEPSYQGRVPIERTIEQRRTVRSFEDKPLTLSQLSQILWSAQGITDGEGFLRAAPSAGALYPIDIYTVVGDAAVNGLEAGVYHYDPEQHIIKKIWKGDKREDVARASLGQMWMAEAPVILLITAEYRRITIKYGERGIRYALIEVGHIGQNIFLQSEALGLGAGIVGAFHDKEVLKSVGAFRDHQPLILIPVGYKRGKRSHLNY